MKHSALTSQYSCYLEARYWHQEVAKSDIGFDLFFQSPLFLWNIDRDKAVHRLKILACPGFDLHVPFNGATPPLSSLIRHNSKMCAIVPPQHNYCHRGKIL